MPVLKIIHLISSLARGGRERQLATIYHYSDRRKIDAKIVCFNRVDNSYIEEYQMEGDVIYLKAKSKLGRLLELRKLIKTEDITIVWTWGGIEATLGILTGLFSKAKHINGSVRHGIVLHNFTHTWRMFMLHFSRNIVANSRAGLQANHLNRGNVMYNGLDKQFLTDIESSSADTRIKADSNNSKVLLVSVANLVPYKDYKTVLYALHKVKLSGKPFRYLIIGEGPERSAIESLIIELGLENDVTLNGRQTDVKGYLQTADIFIHSSRGEGCSNAILEAMAAGLPVIASDTGETAEIIDSTVGRLFEYRNAEQLALHLNELISSSQTRRLLSLNSKIKINTNFSIERMMDDYYTILEKVAN